MSALRSPTTGAVLVADTPHSLRDETERWPVVDGIPFLRTGRDDLARNALDHLDRGDREGALVVLLADQDDWWDGPAPDPDALRDLVRNHEALTLRDAMARLAYGRVGDYFAHRWSDPTFLAGLALMEAHWSAPSRAFELACGIGHYLRELQLRGVAVTGADVVFSKLWLARHFVVGAAADLVCFDAAAPWPVAGEPFDLVLCQDAFYFLEPKATVLGRLRAATSPGGALRVGHIHNVARANRSAGHGLTVEGLRALFPDAILYDDAELTQALADGRKPQPASEETLRDADAFAAAVRAVAPRRLDGGLAVPAPHRPLRRNPLYGPADGAATLTWPSARYEAEYADLATYPLTSAAAPCAVASPANAAAARRREYVDLPERW